MNLVTESLETELAGVQIVCQEPVSGDRGYFSRTFRQHEFEGQGLVGTRVQANTSFNLQAGTNRGLYCQNNPSL